MYSIQIYDKHEVELVRTGVIEGDIYSDGSCYASAFHLMYFREHGRPYDEGLDFSEVPAQPGD
jgi:hypothetical protein